MKKFIVAAVLAGAMSAFAAEDSYLLWMLPDEVTVGGEKLTGNYTAKVIAGGNEWAWNGTGTGGAGTYLNIYDSSAQNLGNGGVSVALGDFVPGYFADAGSLGGTETFFIELWNDQGVLEGVSQGLAYSAAGLGAISGTAKPADVWQNMTFVTAPIPEPNSGLLMLIGCALLGLRRKQKKA